ncbi:MFS transporter [Vogesella sp. LIG4]|uniref:MFS transporter n=1 Tax=Vogesella sp. LIG4 TaxID=1192162 RepID=UPI00081F75B1|nr:MFS transporter [Vogesella sp. LIG4]SCK05772.1 Arabinose efflux permease [Vogesella sp. LIG4]
MHTPWHRQLHARLRLGKRRLLMLLLGLITAVEFFENAMFVFAASHVMGGIDASPREFALVQAAYAVGSMLMIVKQQWLTRHYGYRHYLVASLALFVLGALGSAASGSLIALALARFVQGVGGGALFTSSRILVNLLFAPADRPRALKYFMLQIFSASAFGPAVAALCVESLGWQSIFLVAIPPALLALALCWLLLPEMPRSEAAGAYSAWPLLLFAAAVICLQLMLSQARYDFFAHPLRLLLMTVAGGALLAGFLWQQYRHPDPILHVRELNSPVYLAGLALYFLHYFLSNFSGYLFPVFAEQALALPLRTVGWLNSAAGIVGVAVALAYVSWGRRLPSKKPLMLLGALAMAVTAWWFAALPANATPGTLLPGLLAKGLFSVLLVLPVAGLTFRELGDQRFAHGYQGKNLMRQIAGSIATAVAAVLMHNRQFAVQSELSVTLSPARPDVAGWVDSFARSLQQHGLTTEQAHSGALAELARLTQQQAQLIACQDLYRLLIAFALLTALVVMVQRKLQ